MKNPDWKSADTISQAKPYKNLLFLIDYDNDPQEVLSGIAENGQPKTHRKMLSGKVIGWMYDKEITPKQNE